MLIKKSNFFPIAFATILSSLLLVNVCFSKEKNPINVNTTGKTVIKTISRDTQYPNNSYMIISSKGTVILADPLNIPEGVEPNVITVTHNHSDHFDGKLGYTANCRKSFANPESFKVKDVKVFGIASSHKGNDISKSNPLNVIYVFEVDGLRIAHMGDFGQDMLTPDQLKALGKIDIAFMQFVNGFSNYSVANEKGFKVIEQLKPQIIIPTHSDAEANAKISKIVGAIEEVDSVLTVSKEALANSGRKVVILNNKEVSEEIKRLKKENEKKSITGLWLSATDYQLASRSLGKDYSGKVSMNFDLTPTENNIDVLVGYTSSNNVVQGPASLPIVVRFNKNGSFDVRDGAKYGALQTVTYTANIKYHIRLEVDLTNKQYSVWVKSPDSPEILIAENFKFRSDAPAISDLGTICFRSQANDGQAKMDNHLIK